MAQFHHWYHPVYNVMWLHCSIDFLFALNGDPENFTIGEIELPNLIRNHNNYIKQPFYENLEISMEKQVLKMFNCIK